VSGSCTGRRQHAWPAQQPQVQFLQNLQHGHRCSSEQVRLPGGSSLKGARSQLGPGERSSVEILCSPGAASILGMPAARPNTTPNRRANTLRLACLSICRRMRDNIPSIHKAPGYAYAMAWPTPLGYLLACFRMIRITYTPLCSPSLSPPPSTFVGRRPRARVPRIDEKSKEESIIIVMVASVHRPESKAISLASAKIGVVSF
jgi:hypothetical protein